MEDYKKIVDHYENCFEQYGDTSKGMDWPNESDNMRRCNVMLGLIRKSSKTNPTLLDFGCGTGHLLDYIKSNKLNDLTYAGCDCQLFLLTWQKANIRNVIFMNSTY